MLHEARSSSTVMSLFAVGAVAVSIAAVATPTTPAVGEADPLLAHATGQPWRGCSYQCRECSIGEDEGHDIVEGVNRNASSSHLENCNVGDCGGHECAVTSRTAFDGIMYAIQYGGVRELQNAVETYAMVATYNPRRQAVQINCDVGLIANIPLTKEQITALEVVTGAPVTLTTEQISELDLSPM